MKNFGVIILVIALNFDICLAQGESSPAAKYIDNVDKFTGDFNYSVPLLTVPGPNGESFPLTANYHAGIKVNQEAGLLGLGWNINVGELYRQVNGFPDDFNGDNIVKKLYNQEHSSTPDTKTINAFGPLYFKNYNRSNTNHNMDLYISTRRAKEDESAFVFPDYDDYGVSTPFINGQLSAHIYQMASLHLQDFSEAEGTTQYDYSYYDNGNHKDFTHTELYFRFKDDPASVKISDGYGYPYSANTSSVLYTRGKPEVSLYNSTSNTGLYATDDFGNYTSYDNSTPIKSANYIKYYTNYQIKNSSPSDFYEAPGLTRGSNDLDHLIGAFQITTTDGMTYHFSLPEYQLSSVSNTATLDDSYDLDQTGELHNYVNNNRYVKSWKLTAITGIDYVDANNDNIVNEGDKGYWIALQYKRWIDNFESRYPYYGFNMDVMNVGEKMSIEQFRFYESLYGENALPEYAREYNKTANVTTIGSELYYPHSIKTSSHTAFFVYETKLDDHSIYASANPGPIPRLKLTDIVLLDNKDISDNNFFSSPSNIVLTSDFSNSSSVVNNGELISKVELNSFLGSDSEYLIKKVSFDQDYHLAKKYYANVKNLYNTTSNSVYGQQIFSQPNYWFSGPSTVTLGGKLSLNSIKYHDKEDVKYKPGYDFTYELESSDNPDYNHRQKDYWGYFHLSNKEGRGGYLLPTISEIGCGTGGTYHYYNFPSDLETVDAWSMKKISDPMGADIEINYESDEYVGVGYDSEYSIPSKIQRTFPIKSISYSGASLLSSNESITLSGYTDIHYDGVSLNNGYFSAMNMMATLASDHAEIDFYFPYVCKNSGGVVLSQCKSAHSSLQLNYSSECAFDGIEVGSNEVIKCLASSCHTVEIPNLNSFPYAYVKIPLNSAHGGGIRVKSIKVSDEFSHDYKLNVQYKEGIATGEPDPYGPERFKLIKLSQYGSDRHSFYPMVGYSETEFSFEEDEYSQSRLGSIVYHHQNYLDPFDRSIKDARFNNTYLTPNFYTDVRKYQYITVIQMDGYGKTSKIEYKDKNKNIYSVKKYEYSNYIVDPISVDQEAFYLFSKLTRTDGSGQTPSKFKNRTIYHRVWIKRPLRKIIETTDGIERISKIKDIDPLNGLPIETVYKDPAGDRKSEDTYAFNNTPLYGYLGSKYSNSNNLNLLTLKESTKVYGIPNSSTNWSLVDGEKLYYSTQAKIHSYNSGQNKFSNTTGTIPNYVLKSTKENGDANDANWKLIGQQSLFDEEFNVLEVVNNKNRFSSKKYMYNNLRDIDYQFVLYDATNSNYLESTHSSFENTKDFDASDFYFDGEVRKNNGIKSGTFAHTGDYSLEIQAGVVGSIAPEYKMIMDYNSTDDVHYGVTPGRNYQISVWFHSSSPTQSGIKVSLYDGATTNTTDLTFSLGSNSVVTIGNWTLVEGVIEVPTTFSTNSNSYLSIKLENSASSLSAYADDLRIQPIDAVVNANVFDQKNGRLLYTINNDNLYTKYNYYDNGELKNKFVETLNGAKKVYETKTRYSKPL